MGFINQYVLIFLVLLISLQAVGQHKKHHKHHSQPKHHQTAPHHAPNTPGAHHAATHDDRGKEKESDLEIPLRPNVKLLPAFLNNALGIELEFPLNDKLSVGINGLAKLGRTDFNNTNYKVRPSDHWEDGYRAELALKYYFKKKGPSGLYAQAFGGINKMIFEDGNTRPFALLLRKKTSDEEDLRAISEFRNTQMVCGGLGLGFQTMLIPKHIIVSILVGSQFNFDADNKIFISGYLCPTIGYVF